MKSALYQSQHFQWATFFSVVAVAALSLAIYFAQATTIGTDLSTNKLIVSKTTSDTAGALDLDLTTSATGVMGANIAMTPSADYASTYGSYITINGGPSTGNNGSAAYGAQLNGNAASGGGQLVGLHVTNGGATNGGATLLGTQVNFSGEYGASDLTGAGSATLFNGLVRKTAGGGNVRGMELDVTNSSASSSAEVQGILIDMNVSGDSNLVTQGVDISESGASGVLDDGVSIRSSSSDGTTQITDAIDASDPEIFNAINIGTNHIVAGNTGPQSPTISDCGTNPSSDATDAAGRITVGTGATTACTITFKVVYANTPNCVITGNDTAIRYAITAASTMAFTVSSSADMNSDTFYYICFGR